MAAAPDPCQDRAMPARWLGALTALALPAAAAAQSPPPMTPQVLFEGIILADTHTTAPVAAQLRSDAAHITSRPTFADLTGDDREDAVVGVHSGGAAGVVALYVLSADGTRSGRLRVVFHSQSLYRARAKVAGAVLTIAQPDYSRGDDLCCPSARIDRDYTWEESRRRLLHRATRAIELID
jgi:hypothetical protein